MSKASLSSPSGAKQIQPPAGMTGSSGRGLLEPVVRRLLGDDHVVDVALPETCRGDLDELRLGPELVDGPAPHVPHPAAKPAHHLQDVHRERALVRNPALDSL